MPRVSEAHRRARRDEIAEAAVRVLKREGVANTSIAQVVQESGLSAGAIYANFENKAELARYVAESQLGWRIDLIEAADGAESVRSPADVVGMVLSTFEEQAPPVAVVLQYWGEATIDPDLHEVLEGTMCRLRDAFERAVHPWAQQRSPEDAEALARRTAVTMTVLCQGYLANRGLVGWIDPEDYLATARQLFAAD